MNDTAIREPVRPPLCGWCGAPAVTEVITRPGRKNRMTAHVCEAHAADFEARGMKTTRVLLDEKLKRSQWKASWHR